MKNTLLIAFFFCSFHYSFGRSLEQKSVKHLVNHIDSIKSIKYTYSYDYIYIDNIINKNVPLNIYFAYIWKLKGIMSDSEFSKKEDAKISCGNKNKLNRFRNSNNNENEKTIFVTVYCGITIENNTYILIEINDKHDMYDCFVLFKYIKGRPKNRQYEVSVAIK